MRKRVTLAQSINMDFDALQLLAKNLLINNKNFNTRYYVESVPRTADFIRTVLPLWHEGLAAKIEGVGDVVVENMRAYEEALDALVMVEAKLAQMSPEQRVALGLEDCLIASQKALGLESEGQTATVVAKGMVSDALKLKLLGHCYTKEGADVLNGYAYLAGRHRATNVGIFVVEGVFTRDIFKLAMGEAEAAGLNARRMYVHADLCAYTGPGIEFVKMADIGLDLAVTPEPQQLVFAEFVKMAACTKLENHGRAWEVFFAGKSLGFADGSMEQAIKAAHEREVNNALYANSFDAPDWLTPRAMPSADVITEYPHIKARFPFVDHSAPPAATPKSRPAAKSLGM